MSVFVKRLRGELPRWIEAGVISPAQGESIAALYPEGAESRRVAALFGIIGAAVVATGLFLIIGANWRAIPDWGKIGGLVALLAGSATAGYALRVEPGRHSWFGDGLLMLASLLFLGGIALVSQIFHVDVRPPTEVLIWWLGIVLVPWLTGSKGAQWVSLAAFVSWLAIEFGHRSGWLRLTSGYPDELTLWAGAGFFVGLTLWSVGIALRKGRFAHFAGVHEFGGLLLLQGALYVGAFARDDYWGDWNRIRLAPMLLLTGLVVPSLAWAGRSNFTALRRLAPWLGLAALPAIAALAGDVVDGDVVSFAFWLSLLIFDLGCVHAGVRLGRPAWVNLALGFIALNLYTRYWDFFGSMLDGGVFFVVSGLIILALAFGFEKGRRRLAREIKEGAAG